MTWKDRHIRADGRVSMTILVRRGGLLPPNRRSSSAIIEIRPDDHFLTYGIGVSLGAMRVPEAARTRVPVG